MRTIDVDWFDVVFNAFIGLIAICGIIISPFVAVYCGCKWIYDRTPSGVKKRKEMEAKAQEAKAKTRELKERTDTEIHELEEKLGLHNRSDSAIYYDSFYYNNPRRRIPDAIYGHLTTQAERETYLKNLKDKVENGYRSPDVVIAVEVEYDYGWEPYIKDKCHAFLFMSYDCYDSPEGAKSVERTFLFSPFGRYYEGEIRTLAECAPYSNYFIVPVPGRFSYQAVIENKEERLQQFIDDIKRTYKKNNILHIEK